MTQRRRRVGPAALAVAAFVLISIPLAAPGLALVPGAASGAPGWLRGVYGDGFDLSPETYLALLYVAVAIWVVNSAESCWSRSRSTFMPCVSIAAMTGTSGRSTIS